MKIFSVPLIFAVLLTACMQTPINPTTAISTPFQTQTAVSTETLIPTAIPELSKYNPSAASKLRPILEKYGSVDENKLSIGYWKKIDGQIDKYGEARRILAFEYHGNNYRFYGGAYSMSPEQFEKQITYLCQEDYHFVTGAEIVGYIEGWLTLPVRSIILTTDSGNKSRNTIPTMTPMFERLDNEFGCLPHVNAYIQTLDMNLGENPRCDEDACWQVFRDAVISGYFTVGSHSERHMDFGTLTEEETINDLTLSKKDIKDNMGINVYSLSWPLEVCTKYKKAMLDMGFIYSYGGVDRGVGRAFTYKGDTDPNCLPRLLPPNPDGISGRPNGMNLEEILDLMINHYLPQN